MLAWLRRLLGSPKTRAASRVRDGSTPDKALLVSSVPDEYQWVRTNCPAYEVVTQTLVEVGGKRYDMLTLRSGAGEMRQLFFDISTVAGRPR